MAFVKKVQLGDKVYGLKYSAYTYIVYKNFFGTDFMQDLEKFSIKNQDLTNTVEKLTKKGFDKLTPKEIDSIFQATTNSDVFIRFGVACIATYEYPKPVSPEEIFDRLPATIFYDGQFVSALSDLMTEAVQEVRTKIVPLDIKKKK